MKPDDFRDTHGPSTHHSRGESLFAGKEQRLEEKVYQTLKGQIRLCRLVEDLTSVWARFDTGGLEVLDVGGGSGRFALLCAERGHRVLLVDSSSVMLAQARARRDEAEMQERIWFRRDDFLDDRTMFANRFDLVLLHGAAEWMEDARLAIRKACSLVKPGGLLSLCIFNPDRLTFKHGINGLLLGGKQRQGGLTPPNGLSPREVEEVLAELPGTILLLAGVRLFYGFFRQGVNPDALTAEQWLEQERRYAWREPFCRLGEHSHLLWRAG